MRTIITLLGVLAVAGCMNANPEPKIAVAMGGSKADGTITMGYNYTLYDQLAQADMRRATKDAAQRCSLWGYTSAQPFGGVTDVCHQRGTGLAAGACLNGTRSTVFQCL